MGKEKKLTEKEKGKIDVLTSLKWSLRKIATEIGRSKTAVHQYLYPKESSDSKVVMGRPKLLGERTQKKILQLVRNKSTSCKKVKHHLGLDASKATIYRAIVSPKTLKFKKKQGFPQLTAEHKNKRFDFALKYIRWTQEWNSVIFSDEKKFNLDGPDGFQYYWHDLQSTPQIFSNRVQGGGSVMIWMAFCASGRTRVFFIDSRMNAGSYVSLLSDSLVPFVNENFEKNYFFQQDNAPCHRAKTTKNWLEEKEIPLLEWPSRSPDLNPIENLWGLIARKVYEGGRQFDRINDLKTAILLVIESITSEILSKLASSMSTRMSCVLAARGNSINY